MGQSPDIKIRTLPRKSEKAATSKPKPSETAPPRWIIYVGTGAVALVLGLSILPKFKAEHSPAQTGSKDMSSQIPTADAVTRHLRESLVRQQMLRSRSKLENLRVKDPSLSEDDTMVTEDDGRTYGVDLDSEDSADRLFKELNDRRPTGSEASPDDRIGARLAHRKWVNEMERADRILYVRNFLRSAYDHGYEVELDQNLVVTKVKRITDPKKVNIDQVLDRMAKQGL
jgi:hypothetical protein